MPMLFFEATLLQHYALPCQPHNPTLPRVDRRPFWGWGETVGWLLFGADMIGGLLCLATITYTSNGRIRRESDSVVGEPRVDPNLAYYVYLLRMYGSTPVPGFSSSSSNKKCITHACGTFLTNEMICNPLAVNRDTWTSTWIS